MSDLTDEQLDQRIRALMRVLYGSDGQSYPPDSIVH